MGNGLFENVNFRIYGDCGLLVECGDTIDPVINNKVRSITAALEGDPPAGVIEVVPAYRSLLIIYNPSHTTNADLQQQIHDLEAKLTTLEIPEPTVIEIPVCYGGKFGPDIENVAKHHGITEDDVVRCHSEPEYLIYMIGFTPGFPYLGGLPENLHTPRLDTPRLKVPAGTVGIANNQTGIYPVASPGGWQLIGRTPLKLFDLAKKEPFLLKAGAYLKFRPLSPEDFNRLSEASDQ